MTIKTSDTAQPWCTDLIFCVWRSGGTTAPSTGRPWQHRGSAGITLWTWWGTSSTSRRSRERHRTRTQWDQFWNSSFNGWNDCVMDDCATVFQQWQSTLLQGCPGTVCTNDDLWFWVVLLNYNNINAPFSKVAPTLPAQRNVVLLYYHNESAPFSKFTLSLLALNDAWLWYGNTRDDMSRLATSPNITPTLPPSPHTDTGNHLIRTENSEPCSE